MPVNVSVYIHGVQCLGVLAEGSRQTQTPFSAVSLAHQTTSDQSQQKSNKFLMWAFGGNSRLLKLDSNSYSFRIV